MHANIGYNYGDKTTVQHTTDCLVSSTSNRRINARIGSLNQLCKYRRIREYPANILVSQLSYCPVCEFDNRRTAMFWLMFVLLVLSCTDQVYLKLVNRLQIIWY